MRAVFRAGATDAQIEIADIVLADQGFAAIVRNDPAQLLDASFDTDSAAEKIRIRSYVAAKGGNSREAMFARAWVAVTPIRAPAVAIRWSS